MANTYARNLARTNLAPIPARDVIRHDILTVTTLDGKGGEVHRVHSVEDMPGYVRITFYGGRVIEPSRDMPIAWRYLTA